MVYLPRRGKGGNEGEVSFARTVHKNSEQPQESRKPLSGFKHPDPLPLTTQLQPVTILLISLIVDLMS
jgi:hypothetical protein